MCTWGMDIATQHETPASDSNASSTFGESPSGRAEVVSRRVPTPVGDMSMAGGCRRSTSASGTMDAKQNTPMPM